jgi:hypothetical protein
MDMNSYFNKKHLYIYDLKIKFTNSCYIYKSSEFFGTKYTFKS